MLLAQQAGEDTNSGTDELDEVLWLGEITWTGKTMLRASSPGSGVLDVAENALEDVHKTVLRITYSSSTGVLDISGDTVRELVSKETSIAIVKWTDDVLRSADRSPLACTGILDVTEETTQNVQETVLRIHGKVVLGTSCSGTWILDIAE